MSNYSREEVEVLVEEYAEFMHKKYKPSILIRLIDLDMAFKRLPRVYKEAVLLCGMVGMTTRTAGAMLGVSKDTIHRRYTRGLDQLVILLGGKP